MLSYIPMIDGAHDKPQTPKNKTKKKAFKPPKKISEKYLYNAGLAYLQRFTASSHHFKTVMMRKINRSCRYHTDQNLEECQKLLESTVQKFEEYGYLNDEAYLKGMVTSLRRRGLSQKAIQAKLYLKGYTADQIIQTIDDFDQDNNNTDANGDFIAALHLARKKKIGPFDIDNKINDEKTLGRFARAGFSYDIIQKVLATNKIDAQNILADFF